MAARRACSAAASWTSSLRFSARSAASLLRTALSAASPPCAQTDRVVANTTTTLVNTVRLVLRILCFCFHDFVTRNNLCTATQRCRHAAIFGFREFDCPRYRGFRDAAAADDVLDVKPRVTVRKLFAPLAAHFDAIIGHLLPLLSQNRNHVDTGAASQGEQHQLHRRSCARAFGICLDRLSVSGWREAGAEIILRKMDRGFVVV